MDLNSDNSIVPDGVDAEVWVNLPPEIREELIQSSTVQIRSDTQAAKKSKKEKRNELFVRPQGYDAEVWDALPDDLKKELSSSSSTSSSRLGQRQTQTQKRKADDGGTSSPLKQGRLNLFNLTSTVSNSSGSASASSVSLFTDLDFPAAASSIDGRKASGASSNINNSNNNSSKSSKREPKDVRCACKLPAKLSKVFKQGPNNGRHYYSCGLIQIKSRFPPSLVDVVVSMEPPQRQREGQKCTYFAWADSFWQNEEDIQHSKQASDVRWERFDSSTGYKLCGGIKGNIQSLKFRAESILQGSIGDCWFLSALAVVSTNPALVQQLVSPMLYPTTTPTADNGSNLDFNNSCLPHIPSDGKLTFRLFLDGHWRNVVVDSLMAVRPPKDQKHKTETKTKTKTNGKKVPVVSTLEFSRDSQAQMWVPFLEKAYAKAYGCYDAISGGWINEALLDLTGYPTLEMDFTVREFESEKCWWDMIACYAQGFPMGISTGGASGGQGIVSNHAYSVLHVVEIPISSGQFEVEGGGRGRGEGGRGISLGQQTTLSSAAFGVGVGVVGGGDGTERGDKGESERGGVHREMETAQTMEKWVEEGIVTLNHTHTNTDTNTDTHMGIMGVLRLVCIRNPWGAREFTGNFSDKSQLWSASLRAHLAQVVNSHNHNSRGQMLFNPDNGSAGTDASASANANANAHAHADTEPAEVLEAPASASERSSGGSSRSASNGGAGLVKKKNDGTMWMSWHDCLRRFTSLDVCAAPSSQLWPNQKSQSLDGLIGTIQGKIQQIQLHVGIHTGGVDMMLHVLQPSLRKQERRGRYRNIALLVERVQIIEGEGEDGRERREIRYPVGLRIAGGKRASPVLLLQGLGEGVYYATVLGLGCACAGLGMSTASGNGNSNGNDKEQEKGKVNGSGRQWKAENQNQPYVLRLHSSQDVRADPGLVQVDAPLVEEGLWRMLREVVRRNSVLEKTDNKGREEGKNTLKSNATFSAFGMSETHNFVKKTVCTRGIDPCNSASTGVTGTTATTATTATASMIGQGAGQGVIDNNLINLVDSDSDHDHDNEGGDVRKEKKDGKGWRHQVELSVWEAEDVRFLVVTNSSPYPILSTIELYTAQQYIDSPFQTQPPQAQYQAQYSEEMQVIQVTSTLIDPIPTIGETGDISINLAPNKSLQQPKQPKQRLCTRRLISVSLPAGASRIAAAVMPLEGMPTYILQQAGIQMQIRERELAVPAARGNGDQSLRIVLSGAERLNLPQPDFRPRPEMGPAGRVEKGKAELAVVDGYVVDISMFLEAHPGGREKILSSIGCERFTLSSHFTSTAKEWQAVLQRFEAQIPVEGVKPPLVHHFTRSRTNGGLTQEGELAVGADCADCADCADSGGGVGCVGPEKNTHDGRHGLSVGCVGTEKNTHDGRHGLSVGCVTILGKAGQQQQQKQKQKQKQKQVLPVMFHYFQS